MTQVNNEPRMILGTELSVEKPLRKADGQSIAHAYLYARSRLPNQPMTIGRWLIEATQMGDEKYGW